MSEIKTVTNTGGSRTNPTRPTNPPIVKPPPRPQGRGNLLYTCAGNAGANVGGVAKCVGAYSGTPVWSSMNGSTLDTAAKKNVYSINFDPFSVTGNSYFTRIGALTQDGFYIGTGMPSAPVWTKKLDSSAASTLLGVSVTLGKSWTFNVRRANQILILAYGAYNTLTGNRHRVYTLWSNDLGATWNGNASYYVLTTESTAYNNAFVYASYHRTGYYYITGRVYGNQSSGAASPVLVASTLPQFSIHLTDVEIGNQVGNVVMAQPYTNKGGTSVYQNDNIAYIYGLDYSTGASVLQRISNFQSGGTASLANAGAAGMNWGFSTASPYWFFPHTFNENYIIGARTNGVYTSGLNEIWVTTNGGASWTKRLSRTSSRTDLDSPTNLYLILADEKIFFTLGHDSTGNVYVGKTLDLGATFTDVSNFGTANYLDTVLGVSDYAHKIIMCDYYKV